MDTRLATAQSGDETARAKQQRVKADYESWEIGWAEENGREPSVQDV